jgi:ferredoxin-nitrate reductase
MAYNEQDRESEQLKQHIKQAFVEINPDDARRLRVVDEEIVVVSSRRGDVRVKAKVTSAIKKGVVFLPMHWGKILGNDLNRSNNLTNDLVDPISKEPDFKFCAVHVAKYEKPKQRVVIMGLAPALLGL